MCKMDWNFSVERGESGKSIAALLYLFLLQTAAQLA